MKHNNFISDQLSDNNLLNRLRDENFDVAINEATALCGYALTLKIGVKKLVSAMPISLTEKFIEPFAIDVNPSYIPGKKMLTTSNISGFNFQIYGKVLCVVHLTLLFEIPFNSESRKVEEMKGGECNLIRIFHCHPQKLSRIRQKEVSLNVSNHIRPIVIIENDSAPWCFH